MIRMLQYFAYFSLRVLQLILPISRKGTVACDRPYIIISNHKHRLDAVFIVSQMRFREFRHFGKLHFLTWHTYLRGVGNLLRLLGAFSTHPKGTSLQRSRRYLEGGGTVYLCPEGQVTRGTGFDDSELGVGAVYLERALPDRWLLPVKITLERWRVVVEFKEPIRHKKFGRDLKKLMRETMIELYT